MITLPKLADSIIRQVESIRTDKTKFETKYLFDLIHQAKATVQSNLYKKYGKINSSWTVQYFPDYEVDLQETNTYKKFSIPTPSVTLGGTHSGIVYVGSVNLCDSFPTVQSRGELSNYLSHRVTKDKPVVLYSDTFLELYNCPIKNILIDYVPANPTLLPTYNLDIDNYPLDDEGIDMLMQLIKQATTGIQAKMPVDYLPNKIDTATAVKN